MQKMQTGVFRLSPQQGLLWELRQQGLLLPPVVCTVSVEGSIDIARLRHALHVLVSRHEILRTRVGTIEGNDTPRQIVGPTPSEPALSVVDLSTISREIQDEACAIAEATTQLPMQDTMNGATVELTLLRLGCKRSRILVRFSPFCADRAGALNFLRELTRAYDATEDGLTREEGELQYADISEWQHELLEAEEAKVARERWNVVIPEAQPNLTRRIETRETGLLKIDIEDSLTRGLKTLAEVSGVSEAALLLTCWQILVLRHSEEVVSPVGVFENGRGSQELAGVIGPMLRSLPVSNGFRDADSFVQASHVTERTLTDARRWQAYLPPLAVGARLDYCFEFESEPEKLRAGDAVLTVTSLNGRPLTFAALLSCTSREDALACQLQYDTNSIDARRAALLASRFVALLRNVVATPNGAISRMDVVGAEERGKLLCAPWNIEEGCTVEECIHQLFEKRAREHPDRNAVTFEGRHMTYGELDARANALARRLVIAGVGPEARVGVFAEPSHLLVVALLAVLKSGGSYVPIDPSTPTQRIATMLDGSGATALLCQRSLASVLPESHVPTHFLDAVDATDELDSQDAFPSRDALSENLAYVIFTSGSTGTPKGVLITHANVLRLLKSTEKWFRFGERDVWTMFHSHAFDFSVWEMWGALLTGGRLVLVPQRVKISPVDLREMLHQEGVTIINQTPSVFRLLAQVDADADSAKPLSLRTIIFGGEALDPQSLESWIEHHGDECPRLINMYGITETTVHVTYRVIKRDDLYSGLQSPIGVPMSDMGVYVLDRNMNLVPRGSKGELYVGGAGLARGYIGRPDLTAERFVPDPFSAEPGARIYKSGDGLRMLEEDDLDYIGRIDQQVKIRGFRVELGEIESAMRARAGVKDASVICIEERGEKRLVGFYTADDGADESLREFLSASLPAYMLPSPLVRLETMPLTVNGKADRKKLEEMARAIDRSGAYVAPRTPLETEVAEVWARMLGHERVGIEDHFFDLGGHSLLATQIAHELRESFQVDVPLAWFFDGAPTVSSLATLIEARRNQMAEDAELAAALAEIDALTDEEVRALLAKDEHAEASNVAHLEQI